MLNPNRFYTYAYLRDDKTPYYIGKGQTNRLLHKKKTETKPPKDKSRIIFLKKNLTEDEAFKHEIYMIHVFGRKDLGTGILLNRTNGGEGNSGKIWSTEERKKKSNSSMGEKNPFYGKTHNKEVREIVSKSRSKQYIIVSPTLETYKIKNLKKFCIEYNLDYTSMNKLANGKYGNRNSYKGWSIEKVD